MTVSQLAPKENTRSLLPLSPSTKVRCCSCSCSSFTTPYSATWLSLCPRGCAVMPVAVLNARRLSPPREHGAALLRPISTQSMMDQASEGSTRRTLLIGFLNAHVHLLVVPALLALLLLGAGLEPAGAVEPHNLLFLHTVVVRVALHDCEHDLPRRLSDLGQQQAHTPQGAPQ